MIIVQAPLRVSFFGGGTDFPSYYLENGGCVLTSSIDKFVYVTIKSRFDDFLRVGYTSTEIVETVDEVKHELIREALRKTGIRKGVEITTMGDVPAGTGLGSSSSITVGALQAMYTYLNESPTQEQLADEACDIEIKLLRKPIGKQDQYIAAFGGLRMFEFHQEGNISNRKVTLDPQVERHLNESLLLFFTGVTRQASSILEEQKKKVEQNNQSLTDLKCMAYQACAYLEKGDLEAFGCLLDESWVIKQRLASQISNDRIADAYSRARAAGAWGGKITGAGGGGFLLLLCPLERRERIRTALSDLREVPFRLTRHGSKVIFHQAS